MPGGVAQIAGQHVQGRLREDGLELEDWMEWFFKRTNHFEGAVLQFTKFKY